MTSANINSDDDPEDHRYFHVEVDSTYYQGIDIRPDHISADPE